MPQKKNCSNKYKTCTRIALISMNQLITSMSGCSRQWNCKHLDPVDSMQLVLNPKFALLKTEIRMLVFILKENFEKVVTNLLPFQK